MNKQNKVKKCISITLIGMILAIMIVPIAVLSATNQNTNTKQTAPDTGKNIHTNLIGMATVIDKYVNSIKNLFNNLLNDGSLSGSFR